MVSIQQARQQLQTQQRQVQQKIRQIEQTKLPSVTRQQLARATPQTQVRYKSELPKRQAELEKAKKEAISKLKEFEKTQLEPYERKISMAEAKQKELEKKYERKRRKEEEKYKKRLERYKEQQKKKEYSKKIYLSEENIADINRAIAREGGVVSPELRKALEGSQYEISKPSKEKVDKSTIEQVQVDVEAPQISSSLPEWVTGYKPSESPFEKALGVTFVPAEIKPTESTFVKKAKEFVKERVTLGPTGVKVDVVKPKEAVRFTAPSIGVISKLSKENIRALQIDIDKRGVEPITIQTFGEEFTKNISPNWYEKIDIKAKGFLPGGVPPPEQVTKNLDWVKGKWEKAEMWTKQKTTYPLFEKAHKLTGETIESFAEKQRLVEKPEYMGLEFLPEKYKLKLKPFTQAEKDFRVGFTKGALTGIKEKPLKSAVMAGSFFIASPVVGAIGKVAPTATKVVGWGLTGLYAGGKGYELYQAPTAESRGEIVGQTLTTEIIPAGVGITAYKGIHWLKTPQITPLKPPKTQYISKDITQPIIYKGQQIQKTHFLVRAYTPSRQATSITGWGKLTGKAPKIIDISKPSIYYVRTPSAITTYKGRIVEPSYFYTMRAGKSPGYVTMHKIAGVQKPLNIKNFKSLTNIQKFQLQRLAELKTGVPVSETNVPKILGKNFNYQAYLKTQKLFRLYPKTAEFRPAPKGRTIERFESFIKAKPIKKIPQKISKEITLLKDVPKDYKIWATETILKKVTMPFSRATGKTPFIRGVTLQLPPKDLTPSDSFQVFTGLKTIQTTKPPLKLFGDIKASMVGAIPKPPKVVFPKTAPTITPKLEVLGATKITSILNPVKIPKTSQEIPQKVIQKGVSKVLEKQVFIPKVALKPRQVSKTKVKTQLKESPQLKWISIPNQKSILKSSLKSTSVNLLKTKLKISPTQTSIPTYTPTPKKPIKPTSPIIPKTSYVKKKRIIKRKPVKKRKKYSVFVRRRKKDIKILDGETIQQAKAILKRNLKRTLSASGYISENGKKIKIDLGREFRPSKSKKEYFRVVQKRKYRLGTSPEVREIQYFKSKAPKKKKKSKKSKTQFKFF